MSAHSITQLRYKFFAPAFLRLIFSRKIRKIQIQRCQTFISAQLTAQQLRILWVTHLRLPPCIVYTVLPSVKSSDFP